MATRLQRRTTPASCVTSTSTVEAEETGPNHCHYSQTFCAQSSLKSSLLHMVQYVSEWVAPIFPSQHSPSPPLNFCHTQFK